MWVRSVEVENVEVLFEWTLQEKNLSSGLVGGGACFEFRYIAPQAPPEDYLKSLVGTEQPDTQSLLTREFLGRWATVSDGAPFDRLGGYRGQGNRLP